ncbi:hypothetical protein ACKGJN_16545, partial [Gillisia sp. Q332]|uniref:hypothetical protein n=1 Tax=Gillisia xinjiangensis TaxID=3384765 RepID=UPI00391874F2
SRTAVDLEQCRGIRSNRHLKQTVNDISAACFARRRRGLRPSRRIGTQEAFLAQRTKAQRQPQVFSDLQVRTAWRRAALPAGIGHFVLERVDWT